MSTNTFCNRKVFYYAASWWTLKKIMCHEGKGSMSGACTNVRPYIFFIHQSFHDHFKGIMQVFLSGGQYTQSTGARLQVRTVCPSRRDKERRYSGS
jgi:hypothetical protein